MPDSTDLANHPRFKFHRSEVNSPLTTAFRGFSWAEQIKRSVPENRPACHTSACEKQLGRLDHRFVPTLKDQRCDPVPLHPFTARPAYGPALALLPVAARGKQIEFSPARRGLRCCCQEVATPPSCFFWRSPANYSAATRRELSLSRATALEQFKLRRWRCCDRRSNLRMTPGARTSQRALEGNCRSTEPGKQLARSNPPAAAPVSFAGATWPFSTAPCS